mmetsp:Transcript_44462/g.72542  ORF Transcript_44462/g.72542 Transcript_44462/m.72542 type:complete len:82 (+) Transcript_44462:699-944(+)
MRMLKGRVQQPVEEEAPPRLPAQKGERGGNLRLGRARRNDCILQRHQVVFAFYNTTTTQQCIGQVIVVYCTTLTSKLKSID